MGVREAVGDVGVADLHSYIRTGLGSAFTGMDKAEYIQRRRKRYLAQTLDEFESVILPLLPESATPQVTQFKATVRQKFNALAVDAAELVDLGEDMVINGAAVEQKDRIFPHGRPQGVR